MNDFRIGEELNDEVKSSAQEIVATKSILRPWRRFWDLTTTSKELFNVKFNSKKGKLTIL